MDESFEVLRERHRRLLTIASAIVNEAQAAPGASPDRPMSSVRPFRLRQLRREINGEPQSSGFATMSAS